MSLTVAVNLHRGAWLGACPAARQLARQAARRAVRDATGAAATRQIELGIVLTDDAEQRRLNRAYRGKDAPTNVLAFPAATDEACRTAPESRILARDVDGPPLLLGDVVLAFETVSREAAAMGRPLADRLRHLVVHGTLHLLGYDHGSDQAATAMELLETAILAKLGVSDPYRDAI